MLIKEFHRRFMSKREKSRIFDLLRRVSRLETKPLLSGDETGWHEWPVMVPDGPGLKRT
jgi:hypothetical protein